jgi:hypothetical protein
VVEYKVAAYRWRRRGLSGHAPEGKRHAYIEGASATACGLALEVAQLFRHLTFRDTHPTVRCQLCNRVVLASDA